MARKTNLDEAMEAEMEGVEDSDESEEEMEGNRGENRYCQWGFRFYLIKDFWKNSPISIPILALFGLYYYQPLKITINGCYTI